METVKKPKTLYHYTTMDGLKGILESKSLWATKIHYLNDASELSKALKIANNVLENLLKNTSVKEDMHLEIQKMLMDIDSWRDINWCVASLCTNGDLLSQWRGYGSYGSAFSIGFDVGKLAQSIVAYNYELHPCRYFDEKGYEREIEELIKSTLGSEKVRAFIGTLIKNASLMKLDCFIEENEWRITPFQPQPSTDSHFNFRIGKSMIVPYFEIPIDKSSIIEVKIGPGPNPKLVEDAIHLMFHKYDIANQNNYPKTSFSKIPYRVI